MSPHFIVIYLQLIVTAICINEGAVMSNSNKMRCNVSLDCDFDHQPVYLKRDPYIIGLKLFCNEKKNICECRKGWLTNSEDDNFCLSLISDFSNDPESSSLENLFPIYFLILTLIGIFIYSFLKLFSLLTVTRKFFIQRTFLYTIEDRSNKEEEEEEEEEEEIAKNNYSNIC